MRRQLWLCLLLLVPAVPLSAQVSARRSVAITIDDVPGVNLGRGACSRKALEQLNRKLLAALTRNRAPALGLVVEGSHCGAGDGVLADVLRMWVKAGMELGNHSYAHRDLNNTSLVRYQADVVKGETTTRRVLREHGKSLEYFRYPFLHAGKDLQTKRAFERFLASRGYRVAPVTIDNQEWVFAAVYADAVRRGDRALMQRVGTAYVEYMEDVFAFFEQLSVDVVGYEIKQVLLLHDNPLNADYFDRLALMMKRRGYTFISIGDALQDPAYGLPDDYAGPRGLSWLHRWSLTRGRPFREEPREPAWIQRLYQAL